jgi:hypothetical protein
MSRSPKVPTHHEPPSVVRRGVHPALVCQWTKKLLERATEVFTSEGSSQDAGQRHHELLKKVGALFIDRGLLLEGRCAPAEKPSRIVQTLRVT